MSRKEIELKYGFPNFTRNKSTVSICGNKELSSSDIWALWDYAIKKNAYDKNFMTSLLDQAKFFYEAAEKSPIYSQPLLYYYSFLNFAKILINVENRYGKNARYMHGVNAVKGTRFSNSSVKVLCLKPGIKNVSSELLFTLDSKRIVHSLSYNVKELMTHCVGIHRTYSEVYSFNEIFYKIENLKLFKDGKKMIFNCEIHCTSEQVEDLMQLGYNLIVEDDKIYWEEYYETSRYTFAREDYYNFSQFLKSKGLWYFMVDGNYISYISNSPTRGETPEFIIYNIMFFLGSITRYHPYMFEQMFTDKEKWLMSEFLITQPIQFLYSSTSKILGQTILKGHYF